MLLLLHYQLFVGWFVYLLSREDYRRRSDDVKRPCAWDVARNWFEFIAQCNTNNYYYCYAHIHTAAANPQCEIIHKVK